MNIPEKQLLQMYRNIVLSRKVQKKILELNVSVGDFSGWLHMRTGEEAPAAAVGAILTDDDFLGGHLGAETWECCRGTPVKLFLARMMGRQIDGAPTGLGQAQKTRLRIPASSSLGDVHCANVGVALAAKLSHSDRIVVSPFGDGTAARGPVHESINLAAVWQLPVVFLCINNQFGISMRVSASCRAPNIADRASGYGIPGVTIDGNDVFACYDAIYEAAKRAREGFGSSLVEAKTYRLSPHFEKTYHRGHGHYGGDPEAYRPQEEVEAAWQKEPLGRYRETLVTTGVLSQECINRYDTETTEEVEEAARIALAMPYIDANKWLSRLRT